MPRHMSRWYLRSAQSGARALSTPQILTRSWFAAITELIDPDSWGMALAIIGPMAELVDTDCGVEAHTMYVLCPVMLYENSSGEVVYTLS